MTQQEIEREIKSGWARTLVTTALGVVALAGSTYTVVAKITAYEIQQKANTKEIAEHSVRIRSLEGERLPDGQLMTELKVTLDAVNASLSEIKRRLDRIEQQRNGQRYNNP